MEDKWAQRLKCMGLFCIFYWRQTGVFMKYSKEINCLKNFKNYNDLPTTVEHSLLVFSPPHPNSCNPYLQFCLHWHFFPGAWNSLNLSMWGTCSWILAIIQTIVWLTPVPCIFFNTRKKICSGLQLVGKIPSCLDWWQKSDALNLLSSINRPRHSSH